MHTSRCSAEAVIAEQIAVRLAALSTLTVEDFRQWHELEGRAIDPYPYCSPAYWQPAIEHRPEVGGIQIVIASAGGQMLGLMFVGQSRPIPRLPWLRAITTAEPVLFEESVRTYPLVDASRPDDVLAALLGSASRLRLAGLIDFDSVPDGPLGDALGRVTRRTRRTVLSLTTSEYAFARFERTEEDNDPDHRGEGTPDFSVSGSRKRRAQMGQRARALARDVGELSLVDRGDERGAIDDLLTMQMASWKGDSARGGESYRLTGLEPWFRAYVERFREDGRFALAELRAGDTRVYMSAFLRSGGTYFGLMDTFDEELKKYSAGALGRVAVMNWLRRRGAAAFDPNLDADYVQSAALYPDRRHVRRLLVASNIGGALVLGAFGASRTLKRRVHR